MVIFKKVSVPEKYFLTRVEFSGKLSMVDRVQLGDDPSGERAINATIDHMGKDFQT
jgi:hypothetical protein